VLRRNRMLMVLWSVETRDYKRPGVQAIVRNALHGARPGSIILLHDGGGDRTQTVSALPAIVQGFRSVPRFCAAPLGARRNERFQR
jgi:peptidoglycan-N-acetylglucosamine deacetylase